MVVILAIMSMVGLVFNALELLFNLTFLPPYTAIISQLLLGFALYLETKPKKKYYHTSVGEDWVKFVMSLVSFGIIITALIRIPILEEIPLLGMIFSELARNSTVVTVSALTYLAGVAAIVIEVFIKE